MSLEWNSLEAFRSLVELRDGPSSGPLRVRVASHEAACKIADQLKTLTRGGVECFKVVVETQDRESFVSVSKLT